jgi:2-polyprenyl-6-methoxyphenol hydroxylase-like FAD-dependent oxidoreductase
MGQTHNTDDVVSSLDMTSSTRKAVVVGAGPVGCLAAIALAKQGWVVDVYEGRPGATLALVGVGLNY